MQLATSKGKIIRIQNTTKKTIKKNNKKHEHSLSVVNHIIQATYLHDPFQSRYLQHARSI